MAGSALKYPLIVFFLIAILGAIIFGIIAAATSFKIIPIAHVGIVYDTWNQRLEFADGSLDSGQVFSEGRHSIGMTKKFITFPTTYQQVDFQAEQGQSITVLSRDGLSLKLDVSFQFTLIIDGNSLLALYMRWENDFANAYKKIARNVIRDVAADYDAFQFFFNRSLIVADMNSEMDDTLRILGAQVNQVQLLDISLPTSFNSAIQQTEVTRTKINEAIVDRERIIIQAGTELLAAQEQAKVLLVQANTRASTTILQAEQEALVVASQIKAEELALLSYKDSLGLDTDELLSYLYLQAIQETKAKITMAAPAPVGVANV